MTPKTDGSGCAHTTLEKTRHKFALGKRGRTMDCLLSGRRVLVDSLLAKCLCVLERKKRESTREHRSHRARIDAPHSLQSERDDIVYGVVLL